MKAIENLLRERIGLDAASIGSSLIERTARLRMKALGLRRSQDYLQRLEELGDEWKQLVEAVVVSETWFFRDRESFDAFVQSVLGEWLPRHPAQSLRILSAPCATGEEPYSVAMALLDAGVPAGRFVVDALDISRKALDIAKRGVYGRNAFRGKPLSFRDRYFAKSADGFVLSPSVGGCVRFHLVNLVEDDLPDATQPFDFIFCRNLLIYFDRPTQLRVLRRLRGVLAEDGLLFVGPAELPLVLDQGFAKVELPMAFACRRTPGPRHAARSAPGGVAAETVLTREAGQGKERRRPRQVPPAADAGLPAKGGDTLQRARGLADAGQLQEARRLCEEHLRTVGPAADAYYLMGLVADAKGESGALDYYRKALYLKPDHYESLVHMAFILEKQGRNSEARICRRRAERVKRELAPT